MVQSAIFVPGISVTNNNTRLKNMDMRKVKFAMMILAASLLTACGSSKKEQSVNEETAAARTQETENLLANLKKSLPKVSCSAIMTIRYMVSAGKVRKAVRM